MRKLAVLTVSYFAICSQAIVAQETSVPPPPRTEAANDPAPLAASAMGSARLGPERRFTGADLFDLAIAADPQISPNGEHIAYVRRSNDIMADKARSAIWLIDTRTGEESPVAGQDGDAFSPRWSPDGERLAYVSTQGRQSAALGQRWMAVGEAIRLTRLPTSPGSIAWSPDGRSIAYTMLVKDEGLKLGAAPEARPESAEWAEPLEVYDLLTHRADGEGYLKPGFEKIFLVPAAGGAPRQLTFGAYHDGGPLSWSPDGGTIYFGANRSPDWQIDPVDREIWALDIVSGGLLQLTNRDGPDHNPVVSPDGRSIAYLGFDDVRRAYENHDLYVMNRDGTGRRRIAADWDFSPDSIFWDADGRAIYAQYDDRGETKVARIALDGFCSRRRARSLRRRSRPSLHGRQLLRVQGMTPSLSPADHPLARLRSSTRAVARHAH